MKQYFTIFIFLIITTSTLAQNVIWSEDFSGGQVPLNWTNIDVSGQIPIPWIWQVGDEGSYFGSQPYFSSPTVNNGFLVFDSYLFGIQNGNMSFPQNHDGRLTTAAVDCSNLSTVVARFSNQYSYFTTGGNSQPLLGVSADGTNFTYFPILTTIPSSSFTDSEQVEEVDISAIAAGESTVYLQFRWVGNYEYTWRIDDIKIQDSFTPLLPNNTAITYSSIPNSYQFPASQIDTFFLESRIENLGINTQNNVRLSTTIADSNNQIIYTDSSIINNLTPSTTNTLVELNAYYNPNLTPGIYNISYNLSQDSLDDNNVDNQYNFDFLISDSTFALDNDNFIGGFAAGNGPIAEGAYAVANYYYIPNGGDIATSVTFAVNNPFDIPNETVELILYQVDANNDGNLDDDGNGFFNSMDIINNVKGFAQYTFTGNEFPNQLITVPLQSFNNPLDSIPLDSASSYIIVLEYTGNNLMLFTANTPIPYTSLSSIGVDTNTDTWYLGGFPNGILAVIRLNIQDKLSNSKPRKLAENTFEIFPNPVQDKVNLTFNTNETIKELVINITDITGKNILSDNLQNINNQTISYNINTFPNGFYFINIKTEKGQLTKKLIIDN